MVPRPLREFDLADQAGIDPVAALHFGGGERLAPAGGTRLGKIGKWAADAPDFGKARMQGSQQGVIEAGADLPAEDEFLVSMDSDEQRAEIIARAFGIG